MSGGGERGLFGGIKWRKEGGNKVPMVIRCKNCVGHQLCPYNGNRHIYPMRLLDRFNSLNTAWDFTASLYCTKWRLPSLWRLNHNYKITTLWGQTNSCWPMYIKYYLMRVGSQNKFVGYAIFAFYQIPLLFALFSFLFSTSLSFHLNTYIEHTKLHLIGWLKTKQ